MDYLTTHTSLSPIWRWFAPGVVNYRKGCTRLPAASDKAYKLIAYGRWFSSDTPASSTTKTGHHDIVEILMKAALNPKIHSNSFTTSVSSHLRDVVPRNGGTTFYIYTPREMVEQKGGAKKYICIMN